MRISIVMFLRTKRTHMRCGQPKTVIVEFAPTSLSLTPNSYTPNPRCRGVGISSGPQLMQNRPVMDSYPNPKSLKEFWVSFALYSRKNYWILMVGRVTGGAVGALGFGV